MFSGIVKLLGGLVGEAVIDEFEDRVESTLDNAKVKIEHVTENVIRKLLAVALLVVGLIFGLVGFGMFLTAKVRVFGDGVGFIVIGLFIVLLAMVAKFTKEDKR